MKKILQLIAINTVALYLTSIIFSGLKIEHQLDTLLIGGAFLTFGEIILKPVLHIITLPFTIITLGLFSLLINSIVLFVVSYIYPKIQIVPFIFEGVTIAGVSIPAFNANIFLSFFIISATIYLITKVLSWIFDIV